MSTHTVPAHPVRGMGSRRRHAGFTLVELMVAITLGLFLLIGLVSLIVSNVKTRAELDKSVRQIENGRYALQLLSEDFQLAGFIGTSGSSAFTSVTPIACPASIADLGYVAATSNVPMSVYALSSVPTACSSIITNVMPNTAIGVVTRVNTNAIALASAAASEAYLQVSSCATDTQPFAAATGASTSSFNLMQKDCVSTNLTPLRKIMQHVYFVSTCNVCTGTGADTTPTLKVAEYVKGAMTVTPLVEGIQNLQFDYGIDMNGSGSPDCYVSNPSGQLAVDTVRDAACPQTATPYVWTDASANWTNVMAVRIHLLARNTDPSGDWVDKRTYDMGPAYPAVGPFNDHFKRHAYSTVARLYNGAGQRE